MFKVNWCTYTWAQPWLSQCRIFSIQMFTFFVVLKHLHNLWFSTLVLLGLRLRDTRSVDPSLWLMNSMPSLLVTRNFSLHNYIVFFPLFVEGLSSTSSYLLKNGFCTTVLHLRQYNCFLSVKSEKNGVFIVNHVSHKYLHLKRLENKK